MTLLLDIGNSRLKWAWAHQDVICHTGALSNQQLNFDALLPIWQDFDAPQVVAVSCVNAPETVALLRSVTCSLWPSSVFFVAQSSAKQCGVRNAYLQPEKLGVDRWLALIAAHQDYPQAVCIADCGTAITLDVMDAKGRHQGGMICPGLGLMQQALVQGTYQLSFTAQDYAIGLANVTEAGIYNGSLSAACGLIERIVGQQTDLQLILTGGDAGTIVKELHYNAIVDETLVLRGLLCIAKTVLLLR